MKNKFKIFFQELYSDHLRLTIYLSLILIFFFNITDHTTDIFLKLFIIAGLVSRTTTHFLFWLVIGITLSVYHFSEWYLIDNHIYLMIYWAFNLSVVLFTDNKQEALVLSSKLLAGLCFFFATFWKIITPEFMDGTFFTYLLIGGDVRFEWFSILISGMDDSLIKANQAVMDSVKSILFSGELLPVEITSDINSIALFMVWWTIFLEGFIAIVYLSSLYTDKDILAHLALMTFIVTTYPVATVITFGLLLTCIGCGANTSQKLKFLYMIIFAFLLILQI
ncbi:MAG: hypothetical protein EA412_00145 [Chitinophagaceae bacterium]|nr:MAG: hypothetical protein EA412_00145 [Chitinophagaceae bacterium]